MLATRRLHLLVAVADTGSIAGAAATAGCSPAAASQQLGILEGDLGVPLRGLVQSPLLADPMVLAVPPRLRPAGDGPVRLADFADAEWIAARAESGFQAVTESVTRAAGFAARISHRADSNQAVLALVAADLGVALILQSAVTSHAGITLLDIAEPSKIVRQMHITSRAGDPNPAISEVRRELTRRAR
jgi:DNA-binding transcriptional LysR family regulator